MDQGIFLGILGIVLTIIFGVIPLIWAKTTWFKQLIYIIKDKEYKVKIYGTKKYPYFEPNISKIKEKIREKYKNSDFRNAGGNYLTVLINELQSTYTIKIMPDIDTEYDELCEENEYENNSFDSCNVSIELDGIINFRYNSEDNKEYLDIMENLFDAIEEGIGDIKSSYQNYSLTATTNKNFDKKPFKRGNKKDNCKNVELSIGDKVLVVNSTKISNMNDCLKKHISKII